MSIQMNVDLKFINSKELKGRTYTFIVSGNNLQDIKDKAKELEEDIRKNEYGGRYGIEFLPIKYYTEFKAEPD